MIYTSDGNVFEDAVAQASGNGEPVIKNASPSEEEAKSMTHSVSEGKQQTPLLPALADKLKQTNDTIGALMTNREFSSSEEGVRAAADLSMKTLGYGTMGAERGALGIFGGRMTQQSVDLATKLERKGYPASEVKDLTGLERGADSMWRKEISDKNSTLNLPTEERLEYGEKGWTSVGTKEGAFYLKPGEYKLGEIFDHPDLYAAYPHMKDLPVNVKEHLFYTGGEAKGMYNPQYVLGGKVYSEPYIELHSGLFNDMKDAKSTLIHEIQHHVQDIEGFHLGGILPEHLKAIQDWLKESPDFEKELKEFGGDINRVVYKHQAHEVESRNAQRRMDSSGKSLATTTEDVPRDRQILSTMKRETTLGAKKPMF